MNETIDYCRELVRVRDRDRYWSALMAPPAARSHLFTLYAFNCEIAEIGLSVSEPLIGQMRLRWWLDALTPIYEGNPPQHPVAAALSETLSQRPLSRPLFEHYLETRERDMDGSPFKTVSEFASYAEGTSSALMALAMEVAGPASEPTLQIANETALAWAYLGLIRSIPYQLQRGRIQLPQDLCDHYQFDRQAMLDHGYKDKPGEGFIEVIEALIKEVQKNLQRSPSDLPPKSATFVSPLLIRILIAGYLEELARVGNDPFQLQHWRQGPRVRDMIKLKWASLTKRI